MCRIRIYEDKPLPVEASRTLTLTPFPLREDYMQGMTKGQKAENEKDC